jgi:electron transport complex protein RnfC
MNGVIDYSLIDMSVFDASANAFLPGTAYVAFSQDGNVPLAACVSPGDRVAEGTVIARSPDRNNVVHSPIPGLVESLCVCRTPDGRETPAAKIRLAGVFSYLGKKIARDSEKIWQLVHTSYDGFRYKLADNGVINTFLKPESLAGQIGALRKDRTKKRRPVIVARLFDSDPSQRTDSFVAEKYGAEVAEGAAILASITDARGIVFAADKKTLKKDFFSVYRTFIYPCFANFVGVSATEYPDGMPFGIAEAVRRARFDIQGDEAFKFSAPALFVDSPTLLNVYHALVFDIPVMTTFVHVSGSVIKEPGIFSVRVGTLIQNIVEECGGFTKKPSLVVINGKILGMSIDKLDVPVTKYVKSVRFLHKSELPDQRAGECVRCGLCRSVCPAGLEPDVLFAHAAGIKNTDEGTAMSSALCAGCVLCNAKCPARLPLSQFISFLKESYKTR